MNLHSSLYLHILIGAICLLLFSGCSPETQYNILSVFFEGVTRPGEEELIEERPQQQTVAAVQQQKTVRGSTHKPFVAGKCQLCHNPNDIAGISKPDFCQQCHRPNGLVAVRVSAMVTPPNKFLHDPVAKALCLKCHEGHEAANPFLVRTNPTAKLCLSCHEKLKEKFPGQRMDCTACHNPHYADTKEDRLLKKSRDEVCQDCHRPPEGSNWLHGPYAVKQCAICHNNHGSPYPHQLRTASVAELCLECHELSTQYYGLTPPKPHHEDLRRPCTQCHNPHYANSAQDYLLKDKGIRPMQLLGKEYGLKKAE